MGIFKGWNIGLGGLGPKKYNEGVKELLLGKPEQNYQQSKLGPEQQQLYNQMLQATQNKGVGGAFGQSADYYRDLLSNDSADMEAFAAPEMRRYNEQIIPDLAEQFAGMGSGGLTSSGFRNAAVSAGTDLSERLGSIRANLRQQGAQGLQNLGQYGLGQFNENIHRPETGGLLHSFAKGAGQAATAYATGGASTVAGGAPAANNSPLTGGYDTQFRQQGLPPGGY